MGASRKIDELIAKTKDWRGDRLAEIRKLIREADPDVVEDGIAHIAMDRGLTGGAHQETGRA